MDGGVKESSAVDLAAMAYIEDENDQATILDRADDTEITDPVSPQASQRADQGLAEAARVLGSSDAFVEIVENLARGLSVELL